MIEFEVEITNRPIGVRFAHADRGETVVIHLVLENKLGHHLGLLPGDILIAIDGKSILEMTSAAALELFRTIPTPFKASFRRFEDDDDFDSDNENSQNDERSQLKEVTSHLMHVLSIMDSETKPLNTIEWDNNDVCEWILNYGKLLNKPNVYEEYRKIFADKKITGKQLKTLDKNDLLKMGIKEDDYLELYSGIQQLNQILFNVPPTQQPPQAPSVIKEDIVDEVDNVDKSQSDNKEEEDDGKGSMDDSSNLTNNNNNNKEPFLPYMYNAPIIKLTSKTKVNVYSARVVAPYKKKPFALYEMEVSDGENEWLLSKRYTEFYRLHQAMKKIGAHVKNKLPRKGIFNNSTAKQVMNERKEKLTVYMNLLLSEHPIARDSKVLREFLSPLRTFVVDE